jgi:membrane-associated phospholipid phosphatase
MTPARRAVLLLAWCLTVTPCVAPATAAGADSPGAPAAPRLGRRDAVFALLAAGAVAGTATRDRRWLEQASANHTRFAVALSDDARHLGEPFVVGAALLAADGAARLARHDRAAAASERVAFACVAAGAVSFAIKEAVGRERPDETGSPSRLRPFSGHDAFPSGHATVAFALAASLDAEARAPWLRAIVYPAAALTAWSRVRDRRHWPSDVVAGAALGGWCAHHADRFAQRCFPRGLAIVLLPHGHGARVTIARGF